LLTRAVKIKAFRLLLAVLVEPFNHSFCLGIDSNFDAPAVTFAFSSDISELVDEFGELIDIHKVNVAVIKDKSESIGMSVLAEPPPNALESLATDAKTATHEGCLGSLNGDVHAVQFDIGTHIVRGLVVDLALDAVVVAERPFLVDAVVFSGGDFEVLNADVFHVFVPLSFLSGYSITDKTGFVNYFF
jgi:hypothetical protein